MLIGILKKAYFCFNSVHFDPKIAFHKNKITNVILFKHYINSGAAEEVFELSTNFIDHEILEIDIHLIILNYFYIVLDTI